MRPSKIPLAKFCAAAALAVSLPAQAGLVISPPNLALNPVDIAQGANIDGGMFGAIVTGDTLSRTFPMTVKSSSPPEQRVAAEFDLLGLRSFTSAYVSLPSGEVLSPFLLRIFDYTGDGIVELYDMNNISSLAFEAALTNISTLEFDVSDALQRRLNAGDRYLGLNFVDVTNDSIRLNSAPGAVLLLSGAVIPEPGTLALLCFGLAGLGLAGQRGRGR